MFVGWLCVPLRNTDVSNKAWSPKGETNLFGQKKENLYLTLVMHPMHLSLIKSYQIGPKGMKE